MRKQHVINRSSRRLPEIILMWQKLRVKHTGALELLIQVCVDLKSSWRILAGVSPSLSLSLSGNVPLSPAFPALNTDSSIPERTSPNTRWITSGKRRKPAGTKRQDEDTHIFTHTHTHTHIRVSLLKRCVWSPQESSRTTEKISEFKLKYERMDSAKALYSRGNEFIVCSEAASSLQIFLQNCRSKGQRFVQI